MLCSLSGALPFAVNAKANLRSNNSAERVTQVPVVFSHEPIEN